MLRSLLHRSRKLATGCGIYGKRMNGFCLRKGEGYFNTQRTENIAIQKEDKNFINTSQIATAMFNKGQGLQ